MATEIQSEQGVLEKAREHVERIASRSGLLGEEKRNMAEIAALAKKSKRLTAEGAAINAIMEAECPRYSNPDKFRREKGQSIVSLPGYPNELVPAHREQAFRAVMEVVFSDIRRETLNAQAKAKYAERDEVEVEITQKRQELNATRSALVN